jgi:molecular chaperone GrpE
MAENGLKEIPSNGRFDPTIHEALAVGEGEDGTILEVFQKGYYLGDKVLRCSKVMVAKRTGDNNG